MTLHHSPTYFSHYTTISYHFTQKAFSTCFCVHNQYILSLLYLTSDNYWDIQDEDIVCIPSANFDATILKKIVGVIHYEERQLYNLFLLKHIKTRLIFLSSKPLDSSIVQYLLSLLPNAVSQSELEKRLIFLTANDESPRCAMN